MQLCVVCACCATFPHCSLLRDDAERQKEVAFLEAQVYRLSELLGEQRAATKDNVERRLARTAEELEQEEEEEVVQSDDEEEELKVLYNPKNLPLGWDGKVSTVESVYGGHHLGPAGCPV